MKQKGRLWGKVLVLLGGGLLLAAAVRIGGKLVTSDVLRRRDRERINVFVSILPQKFFVERIGGERVTVSVMVGPGQNPATYEPLPQQMKALTEAHIYFRIGVPFETAWLDRLSALNPELIMVDTREGIALRQMEHHSCHAPAVETAEPDAAAHHRAGLPDPHIWLDPLLVKIQAETVYRALAAFDPEHQGYFKANLDRFHAELEQLHAELQAIFDGLEKKTLMVYHPAWGYLTDRYGLKQVPLEVEGKEPGPRELAQLIDYAKTQGIRVVFIQRQFNSTAAEAVARAVNGQVVSIDPLAEDYLTNMRRIAQAIKESNDRSGESD
ncbi:MAG TPA: zinc ABC transporter solute-binding protein [Firmicutes bacterium]|nr:zinc ABC transporter solute-binding protein [Bacillota bacterium]